LVLIVGLFNCNYGNEVRLGWVGSWILFFYKKKMNEQSDRIMLNQFEKGLIHIYI
jgi:hypothetical protein